MLLPAWLHPLARRFPRAQSRKAKPKRYRRRFEVEALECRLVPAAPATVYVNSAWSAGFNPGQTITDADPVTAGNQGAIIGETAFATVSDGLAAVASSGTVYVNSGDYSTEAVNIANGVTVSLLGTAPATAGAVTIGSLAGLVGTTVDTGSVGNLANSLTQAGLFTTTTFAGVMSGPGSFTLSGGSLTFAGTAPNTYTGLTTVQGGFLQLQKAGVIAIAGDLTVSSSSAAFLDDDQIAATSNLNLQSATLTVGGFLIPTAQVSVASLSLNNSTINIGQDSSLKLNGDVTLAANGLSLIQGNGSLDLNGAIRTFTVPTNAIFNVATSIVGGVGGITLTGGGSLYLTGPNANTFTGLTDIVSGTLNLNKDNGPAVAGLTIESLQKVNVLQDEQIDDLSTVTLDEFAILTIGSGTAITETIGDLDLSGGTVFVLMKGVLTLNGDVTVAVGATTNSSAITSNFDGELNLSTGTHTFDIASLATLNINVAVTGGGGLTKSGAGILAFNSTIGGSIANTYTGVTTVNDGLLVLARIGAATIAGDLVVGDGNLDSNQAVSGTASVVSLQGGQFVSPVVTVNGPDGIVRLNGNDATFSGLQGSDTMTSLGAIDLGGATLTLDVADGASYSFPEFITGNGNIVKEGNGTQEFARQNIYNGTTTISAGTLIVSANGALGSTAFATTIESGGTLLLAPAGAAPLFYNAPQPVTLAGGTIDVPAGTDLPTLFAGPITLTEDSFIQNTSTAASNNSILHLTGSIDLGGKLLTVETGEFDEVEFAGVIADSSFLKTGAMSLTGSGAVVFNGASPNFDTGLITVEGGFLYLDKSNGPAITGDLVVDAGASVGFRSSGQIMPTANATLNGATMYVGYALVPIQDSPGFTFLLIQQGATAFVGSLSLNDGSTVQLGNSSILKLEGDVFVGGSADSSIVGIAVDSVVDLDGHVRTFTISSDRELTISAGIVGAPGSGLTLAGGTLTFDGPFGNGLFGTTTVESGTLNLDSPGIDITGDLVIGDGSGLADSAVVNMNNPGVIAFNSDVSIDSDGELNLNGFDLTIFGLSGTGDVVGGTGSLTNTLTLVVPDLTTSTFAGEISGSGLMLADVGPGTFDLTGSNTYTGVTSVSIISTLAVNGSITSDVDNSGTLRGSGTITGNVTGTGVFQPGNSPGIMTIDGDFTPLGSVRFEVNSNYAVAGTDYGEYVVAGNVDLSLATLTFLNNGDAVAPAANTLLTLISKTSDGATIASPNPLQASIVTIASRTFYLFYNGGDGNDVVLVEASTPTSVYVSTDWASGLNPGQLIPDADPVSAGNQVAIFSVTGFGTINDGLAAVAAGGTAYVNSGDYSTEAVDLANGDTIRLLGVGPATPGTVIVGSLAGASGITVDTGTVGGLANTIEEGALAASTTFAGLISGPGSLSVQGGTLTLTAQNTFAGGTTIGAGTIVDSIANALPPGGTLEVDGTLDLNGFNQQVASVLGTGIVTDSGAAATFTINNTVVDTFDGTITGANLSLTKSGTGILTLTNANTYGGSTSIAAGTLALGVDNALPIATDLNVTGTLDLAGFDQQVATATGTGTVTNSSATAATFTVNNGSPDTFAGLISGNLSLTKINFGALTLTHTNSYTGATTITAGTIVLGIANALPIITVLSVTGTLNLNGHNQQVASVTGNGTVTNSGAAATFKVNNADDDTFAGTITGATLSLAKSSSGTLTLTSANSYGGSTTITAGTLSDGIDNALPTGTALIVNGTFDLSGFLQQVASVTGTGTVTNSSSAATTFTVNNAAADTFAGLISGNLSLTKINVGRLTLGSANTYAGATTISAGTIADGIANALPTGTDLSVAGTLDLNGRNQQVASVVGPGIVTNSSGSPATFTVSNTLADTFAGKITGNLAFTKTNVGIFTLTNANTYTGQTTVNVGATLAINGSVTSSVVNSGTLRGTGTITGNVSGTGIFQPGNSPGIMTIKGNFTPTGTVVFEVNSAYTTAGTEYSQFIVNGIVNLSAATVTFLNNGDAIAPAVNSILTIISKTSAGAVVASTSPAQGSIVTIASHTFFVFYNGGDGNDVVLVEATKPTKIYVNASWANVLNPGQKVLDADPVTAGAQSVVIGVSGFATVTAGLAVAGPGVPVFVNSGSYAGEAVNLSSGKTIKLLGTGPATAGMVTFGSLAGVAGSTIDTGTVGNLANTLKEGSLATTTTFGGTLSGPGGLNVTGGLLVLTGTTTNTGPTTISGGELEADGQLGNSPVSVNSGGILGGTGTITGPITVKSGGKVDPGAAGGGVGTLNAPGGVTFQAGSIYNADISLSPQATLINDLLNGGGHTIVAPGAQLQLGGGSFAAPSGTTLDIIHSTSAYGGVFLAGATPLTEGGTFTVSGTKWKITYLGASGHDVVLSHTARTNVWTGKGNNNLWSNAANWNLGVPAAGDALQFPMSALQKGNVNNLPSGFVVGEIDLLGAGYNITGNPIVLDAGIQDKATGTNSVALNATLDNNTVWTKSGSATLTNSGSINTVGFTLYVGATPAASTMKLAGAITGSGSVNKNGLGALTYSGAASNTYTGTTQVNAGTLNLSKSNPATAIAGSLIVGDGLGGPNADIVNILFNDQIANSCNVTVNSSGYLNFGSSLDTIGNLTLNGGMVNVNGVSGGIQIAGNVTANQTSTISKKIVLVGAGPHVFTVAAGMTLTAAAQITGTGASLTKAGPGTLTFSGNTENLYTGTTLVTGGTLNLAKVGAISVAGPLVVGDGSGPATVAYLTANQVRDAQPITVNSGATLNLNGLSDEVGALNLNSGTIAIGNNGKLTINGNITGAGTSAISGGILNIKEVTRTVSVAASGSLTISAAIASIFAAGLTKTGPGTLTIAGSNTFTGTTAVAAGTLQLAGSLTGPLTMGAGTVLTGSGNTGTLTFGSGSSFTAGLSASGGNQVNASGDINLGNATLNISLASLPAINQTFPILSSATKVVGTFAGLGDNQVFMSGGHLYRINYTTTSVVLTFLS